MYVLLVQWLVNLSVVIRAGQVLDSDRPQGVLPGGWVARGASSARTSKSRKFFGQRYAMMGGWGKACLVLSDRRANVEGKYSRPQRI